jgi:hypothetical protein
MQKLSWLAKTKDLGCDIYHPQVLVRQARFIVGQLALTDV